MCSYREPKMTDQKADDVALLSPKRESNWPHVLFYIHIHVLCLYGIWLATTEAKLTTVVFMLFLTLVAGWGVTVGAHRLWTHRAFKASTSLRVILMLLQTLVGQGPIYYWVLDHRLHHEHFGTEGDPYNHKKGFLFSHLFTHLQSYSPKQLKLMEKVDMSDLEEDSVVMFQKRFYWVLYAVVFLLLPINAPVEYWGETIPNSVFVLGFVRYALVIHFAWLLNSATLVWGLTPEDKYPADTNLVFIVNKSYWPQYHYLMPNDYKCGEFGTYDSGCSTAVIRICAAIGWATDLRTLESETVKDALATAADTKRPITEVLKEAESQQKLRKDHYLFRTSVS